MTTDYEFSFLERGEGNEIPCGYDCELNEGGVCFFRDEHNTDNSSCCYKKAIDAAYKAICARPAVYTDEEVAEMLKNTPNFR